MTTADGESPLAIAIRLTTAAGVSRSHVDELGRLHARQWRLEDATRVPGVSSDTIAVIKADIDLSNARRHRLIDLIDAAAFQPDPSEPCRYYAETVGELCDRLLILDLKRRALGRHLHVGSPDVNGLEQLCRHLAVVVSELIADLRVGRAALPPRIGLKLYNDSVRTPGSMSSGSQMTTASTSTIAGLADADQ